MHLLSLNIGAPELVIAFFAIGFPLFLLVYCLLDISKTHDLDRSRKIIWSVIVFLAPVLGPLCYILWGQKSKTS